MHPFSSFGSTGADPATACTSRWNDTTRGRDGCWARYVKLVAAQWGRSGGMIWFTPTSTRGMCSSTRQAVYRESSIGTSSTEVIGVFASSRSRSISSGECAWANDIQR